MTHTADAVEHSEVTESDGELTFVTPKDYTLAMSPADLQKAVEKAAGRAMRVKITTVDVATASRAIAAPRPAAGESEDAARALDASRSEAVPGNISRRARCARSGI